MKNPIEIMSPAGSYESLMAAIKAGADSIYFGVGELNMRSKVIKFSEKDLERIVKICNQGNVKSYLTLNSVMYDEDLKKVMSICKRAKKAGIDAIIACDISVIEIAKEAGLSVHMSTQTNISNFQAVKFFSKYADTIVLARELSLEQIRNICDKIKKNKLKGPSGKLIRIEAFVHGALCVAISGKCYMSLAEYNSSANRGKCLQSCRRKYRVIDEETNDELIIDNHFVMSPKDLCTIGMIDKLMDCGVEVFKIEGRARGPEYVYIVTKTYKDAIDAITRKSYTKENIRKWRGELSKVFNRGFWENGYYMGKKTGEWSGSYGSKATKEKIKIGKIIHFYGKSSIAQISIESGELKIGDDIIILGKTTSPIFTKVKFMIDSKDKEVKKASKGAVITLSLNEKARVNDEIFLFRERTFSQ
jgi:putative protease